MNQQTNLNNVLQYYHDAKVYYSSPGLQLKSVLWDLDLRSVDSDLNFDVRPLDLDLD